ncbi:MAG: SRPBCC family protein [Planctomycetia bacterium]|nr:SRPBCC family protein [Planctomycetia bacterium]
MATLQFGGEERFVAPPTKVYALLTDLDGLAASIPDLVSAERVDERTLQCTVRPGFSFLRGTMKLRITLDDLAPPSAATLKIDAQGIGVAMKVVSQMQIDADGTGTKIVWRAEVPEMKGLVATVSPGLVKAAADQVIRHGWRQMHEKLGEV